MNSLAVPDSLKSCSPAARLVWLALDADGPLTRAEIRNRTLLSAGGVSSAIRQLDAEGFIEQVQRGTDARITYYDAVSIPETGTD